MPISVVKSGPVCCVLKVGLCVVNNVDDDKGPAHFEYISNVRYSNSVGKLEPSNGCDCRSGCTSGDRFPCVQLNGGELPFNPNGYLVKRKGLVYECGDQCRCPPSCRNRVSQKGLTNQLEVFKTNGIGWACGLGIRFLQAVLFVNILVRFCRTVMQNKKMRCG